MSRRQRFLRRWPTASAMPPRPIGRQRTLTGKNRRAARHELKNGEPIRLRKGLGRASSDQGKAGSREGNAPRDLRPPGRGGGLQARAVLPRHAPRPRRQGRQGAAPAHHRRHLAEREGRARLRHPHARQRLQANAARASRRERGRGRAAEGLIRAARRSARGRSSSSPAESGSPSFAACSATSTRSSSPTA